MILHQKQHAFLVFLQHLWVCLLHHYFLRDYRQAFSFCPEVHWYRYGPYLIYHFSIPDSLSVVKGKSLTHQLFSIYSLAWKKLFSSFPSWLFWAVYFILLKIRMETSHHSILAPPCISKEVQMHFLLVPRLILRMRLSPLFLVLHSIGASWILLPLIKDIILLESDEKNMEYKSRRLVDEFWTV